MHTATLSPPNHNNDPSEVHSAIGHAWRPATPSFRVHTQADIFTHAKESDRGGGWETRKVYHDE